MDLEKLAQIQQTAFNNFGFKPVVIEDCAHSLGSKFNGKPIGTHGNICTFSFQAIKHFTTCDGGMLILNDEKIYKRAKLLRWFGIDRDKKQKATWENDIYEIGYKYQMTDLGASVGLEGLKDFKKILK